MCACIYVCTRHTSCFTNAPNSFRQETDFAGVKVRRRAIYTSTICIHVVQRRLNDMKRNNAWYPYRFISLYTGCFSKKI